MKAIEKYTAHRFSRLKKLLKKYAAEEDIETLHGIRLEIKKIKAILQLAHTYVKGFHAHRNFIPLRNIFRKAGKIREPEVFYQLLLRYEIEGVKDSNIPGSSTQAALSRKFQREIPDFIDVVNNQKHKIEKAAGKISATQANKYLIDKKETLQSELHDKWNERTLHKARKKIKEILYVEAISKKLSSGGESFFDELQELIGQWHDKELLLSILKKGRNQELDQIKLASDENVREIKDLIFRYYSDDVVRVSLAPNPNGTNVI